MVLPNDVLVEVIHEVKSAEPTMLTNWYVDAHSHEAEFDDLHISLVNQHDILQLRVVKLLDHLPYDVALLHLHLNFHLIEIVTLHRICLGLKSVQELP